MSKFILAASALGLSLLTGPARAEETKASQGSTEAATAAQTKETFEITFTNKLIDDKKTWLPATATVPNGAEVKLTLVNTLDEPHGFEVMGLSDAIVVNAKETKTLTFSAKKRGEFKYRCQMHPAHVGGVIVVK